jgi:dTDP-4-dehydrorhamnose 3,5-epimerase-like enzyme
MAKIIKIPEFKNSTGSISAIEKIINFKIKRVYFIYNIKGARGGHKHKKTKQFLICLNGKCAIKIINKKINKTFNLCDKNKGILLEAEDWHSVTGTSNRTIIVVLASEFYSKKDYIYKIT